jgi:hypothetical protein
VPQSSAERPPRTTDPWPSVFVGNHASKYSHPTILAISLFSGTPTWHKTNSRKFVNDSLQIHRLSLECIRCEMRRGFP